VERFRFGSDCSLDLLKVRTVIYMYVYEIDIGTYILFALRPSYMCHYLNQ